MKTVFVEQENTDRPFKHEGSSSQGENFLEHLYNCLFLDEGKDNYERDLLKECSQGSVTGREQRICWWICLSQISWWILSALTTLVMVTIETASKN